MIKKFIFDNYYDAIGQSSNNILFTQILDLIKDNESSIDRCAPIFDQDIYYDDLRFRVEIVDKVGKGEGDCLEDCKNSIIESYNSDGNSLQINIIDDLFDIRWE